MAAANDSPARHAGHAWRRPARPLLRQRRPRTGLQGLGARPGCQQPGRPGRRKTFPRRLRRLSGARRIRPRLCGDHHRVRERPFRHPGLPGQVRARASVRRPAVAVCQNRIAEKSFLRDNGFPHGPFAAIRNEHDIQVASAALFPAILKVARFGYDGKGQATRQQPRRGAPGICPFQGRSLRARAAPERWTTRFR
jgi:hypothetical protein